MKLISFVLLCLALASCVPVEAASTDAEADLAVAPQVEVQTVVEEIKVDPLADGQVEIIGGDEESLREFIQRYLSPIYPGAGEGETKVLIGNLPDDLPIDLPLPDDARIVASVQQSSGFTQVILEASQSPDEVGAFYNQSLVDLGWQPAQPHQEGSGFVSSNQGERFCLDEGDAYLELLFLERIEGRTEVWLTLHSPVVSNICQEGDSGYMDPGSSLIPALEAPPDVQTSGSGAGGSSDGSAYSTADLKTSLSIEALLAHYNVQMEQAGWEQVDQGTSEVVAWSAWKLTDEAGDEWGGNLIVMDNRIGSERRFAIVSVEKVD